MIKWPVYREIKITHERDVDSDKRQNRKSTTKGRRNKVILGGRFKNFNPDCTSQFSWQVSGGTRPHLSVNKHTQCLLRCDVASLLRQPAHITDAMLLCSANYRFQHHCTTNTRERKLSLPVRPRIMLQPWFVPVEPRDRAFYYLTNFTFDLKLY